MHARSATSDYTRYLQISRFISSATGSFCLSMYSFFKILEYKTSNCVFNLHKKKCYTHHYNKHHLLRHIIPEICRYQALSRQLLVLFDYQYTVFSPQSMAYKKSSWVFILHRKKCYTHNYYKHHQLHHIIPEICRYHA